jgi:hypothetical protein
VGQSQSGHWRNENCLSMPDIKLALGLGTVLTVLLGFVVLRILGYSMDEYG